MNEQKIIEVNSLVRAKSRGELIQMCKDKNLTYSGTKHDMAVRLIGGWSKEKEEDMEPSLRLQPSVRPIVIRKNDKGMWEYERIVFDDKTKNAVGYLADTGEVVPLQRSHIEICKRYKFKYMMPEVLDDPIRTEKKEESTTDDDSADEESVGDDEGAEEF